MALTTSSHMTQQLFDQSLQINPNFNVLCCKIHKTGVLYSNIKGHINTLHCGLKPKTRALLIDYISNLLTPVFIHPTTIIPPIDHLTLYKNGLKCTVFDVTKQDICGVIFLHKNTMTTHFRKEHSAVTLINGRPKKTTITDLPYISNVFCQRFFNTGPDQRLFEVFEAQSGLEAPSHPEIAGNIQQIGQKQLQTLQTSQSSQKSDIITRLDTNPWLDRTGWARHLADFDLPEAVKWLNPPITAKITDLARNSSNSHENQLNFDQIRPFILKIIIQQAIEEAYVSIQPDVIGLDSLFYINRKETGEKTNEQPIQTEYLPNTVRIYIKTWYQVLIYFHNTWNLSPPDRPNYNPSQKQLEVWEKLQNHIDLFTSSLIRKFQNSSKTDLVRSNSIGSASSLNSDTSLDSDATKPDLDVPTGPFLNYLNSTFNNLKTSKFEAKVNFLIELFLSFFFELFNQEIPDSAYLSPLISALSILGINYDFSWHSALNYTPVLSAIITTSRWFVLYAAVIKRRQNATAYSANHDVDYNSALLHVSTHFSLVRNWTNQMLVLSEFNSLPKPWNWLYHLRTYGFKIRYTESGPGSIIWNGSELLFADISLSMAQLRGLIHGLVNTAQAHLLDDILFTTTSDFSELPPLNLLDIKDNPANHSPEFSFISDPRNAFQQDNWLYNRVLSMPHLISRFIQSTDIINEKLVWNISELSAYFRQIRQFKSVLLVLIHLSSGGPARAPELLSIRYYNTINGGIRNIFVENGLVSFVTNYHKGYMKQKEIKLINRFMPEAASRLLIYYLLLVTPFEHNMEIIHGLKPIQSAFVWPEKTDENTINPVFKRQRRFTDLSQNQRLHPTESANQKHYLSLQSWNFWTANQMSHAITTEFTTRLNININMAKWRHIYTAIVRQYLKAPDLRHFLRISAENVSYSDQSEDEIADLQSGHSSKIAGLNYGRSLVELPGQIQSQRVKFRQLSVWLHGFYLLDTSSINPNAVNTSPIQDIHLNTFYRFQHFKTLNISEQSHRLFGPDFTFRANQMAVLQSILSGNNVVLNIAATGSGKSFLLVFLALISGLSHVSIIILPLLSLQSDLKDRFLQYGIKCLDWNSQNPPETANVVLITPESFITSTFLGFLNRQILLGRLDRIYYDECHTILDATSSFRPKMLELNTLIGFKAQLVFFTATLPVKLEACWFSLLNILPENVAILRHSTIRSNIKYSLLKIQEKELIPELLSHIEDLFSRFSTGLILIYCGSVKLTQEVANQLHCPAYFRQTGNYTDKSVLIQQFRAGTPRLLATTNALGLGLDIPNIRAIIHVGYIRNLRDFIQESGRAGRDQNYAESWLFYAPSMHFSDQDITDFIYQPRCRRITIDYIMDGDNTRRNCIKPEVLCDFCEFHLDHPEEEGSQPNWAITLPNRAQSTSISQSDIADFHQYQRQEQQTNQNRLNFEAIQTYETLNLPDLDEVLRKWRGHCAYCFYHQIDGYNSHLSSQCLEQPAQIALIGSEIRKQYRPAPYSGCFNCYLPYSLCHRYAITETGEYNVVSNRKCQFYRVLPDVLGLFLYYFQISSHLWMLQRFRKYQIELKPGLEIHSHFELVFKAFMELFSHKVRSYRIESTEMVLFLQFVLLEYKF